MYRAVPQMVPPFMPMNGTSKKKFQIKFAPLRGLLRASNLIAGKVSGVK
jgi:hypothetical protein